MSNKKSSFFNNPLWAANYNGLSEDQKYNRYYAVCQMAKHHQRQNPSLDTQTAHFMAENGYNYGDRMDIHGQFTPASLEQVEAYYKGGK